MRRVSTSDGAVTVTPSATRGLDPDRDPATLLLVNDQEATSPARVHLLWHVHHVAEDEAGNVIHFEGEGCDAREDEGDDVKFLGVYSSAEKAEERIRWFRTLPGFRDEPDCFWHAEFEVDEDLWRSGYITS